MQKQTIDKHDFRKALGQFPTGVTIITTVSDTGEHIGMTASSFNSVSMNPPLILWSIDHRAHSLEIFENCEHFAVNILGEQQRDLSNLFASTGADKFKDTDFTEGAGKVPLLPNCVAQLECKTWNTYDGGDHTIIVGEVLSLRHDDSESALVFYQGDYAEIK
ncbi:flavin reductase family protein [Leucothrix pacifica]|uniref:Flavin reductase like domain-containing protein n=1 Tax=Leucothrix pacifica TaxID=1247513 RepID=A0A317CMS7_9GAMM|nr:flavin reductase family protein [Leucothrix pacifica]PWQ99814.1 hypothetical protein DKW60_04890 [Leucothrix pacifica]